MKLRIMIIGLLAIALFAAISFRCGSGGNKEVFKPKLDTSMLVATFINPDRKIMFDGIYVVKRSGVIVDSLLNVNKITDSLFYIPIKKDSTVRYDLAPKGSVSFERIVDSAIRQLTRWADSNKAYFKPIINTPANQ